MKWPLQSGRGALPAVSTKSPTNPGGGRWRKPEQSGGLEAALKVLGHKELAIRAGLEVSSQRAKEEAKKPVVQRRPFPDSVVAAAREKIAKLEEVLEVLEGTTGAEVDVSRLRAELAATRTSTPGDQPAPTQSRRLGCG